MIVNGSFNEFNENIVSQSKSVIAIYEQIEWGLNIVSWGKNEVYIFSNVTRVIKHYM